MDTSLFFQFLAVIARNKTCDSEQLRSAFSLALAAHELSTATASLPVAEEGPKDVVSAMVEMRLATIKEIEAEKAAPVAAPAPAPAPVEKKAKTFSAKAPMHIKAFNTLIKTHLDMRSNISREKARAVLAAIDGCLYDELDAKIKEQLGKAV
jgi:hypothetical protein